jgi:hypothetical protein
MRDLPAPLAALIESGEFDMFDVYTFDLAIGGPPLLLSTAPFRVYYGADAWPQNGPIIPADGGGQRGHWKTGVDVDEWNLTLVPRPVDPVTGALLPDKIGDKPMLMAIRSGALDGATVTVQRAYYPSDDFTPGRLWIPSGFEATGLIVLFKGLVSDVALSSYSADVKIHDMRVLLSTQMPRNIYQAGCRHTLYDSGCKLNAADYARPGTVTAVMNRMGFNTNAGAPGGSGTYDLGRVQMTSGDNAGIWRTINWWDGGSFVEVSPPYPYAIQIGDTCSLYPGCNKTLAACDAFGNRLNFGGEPFIPPPTSTSF